MKTNTITYVWDVCKSTDWVLVTLLPVGYAHWGTFVVTIERDILTFDICAVFVDHLSFSNCSAVD